MDLPDDDDEGFDGEVTDPMLHSSSDEGVEVSYKTGALVCVRWFFHIFLCLCVR